MSACACGDRAVNNFSVQWRFCDCKREAAGAPSAVAAQDGAPGACGVAGGVPGGAPGGQGEERAQFRRGGNRSCGAVVGGQITGDARRCLERLNGLKGEAARAVRAPPPPPAAAAASESPRCRR